MPKFSQRYGYTSIEKAFQRESIDSALRTKLWNVLKLSIWDKYDHDKLRYDDISQRIHHLVQRLWFHYFNQDMDKLPRFYGKYGEPGVYEIIKDYFSNCEWYEVYDLMETIANDQSGLITEKTREWVNATLEDIAVPQFS